MRKFRLGSETHIYEQGCVSHGYRRDPSYGDRVHGNKSDAPFRWSCNLGRIANENLRVAFAPTDRERVLLGVDVHSCGAKRGDGPFDGFGHLRRASYAAADFVGQPSQI